MLWRFGIFVYFCSGFPVNMSKRGVRRWPQKGQKTMGFRLSLVNKNEKHCASSCTLEPRKFQNDNKMDIVALSRDSVGLLYHYIFCHWFS